MILLLALRMRLGTIGQVKTENFKVFEPSSTKSKLTENLIPLLLTSGLRFA